MTYMREGGLFLRREAISAGLTDDDLRIAVKRGEIVRVRQGAYAGAPEWAQLDSSGRHLLQARATVFSHQGEVALSHASGAVAHGLRVWGADLSRVHLVRLDAQTSRSTHDVVHHSGQWADGGVVEIGGVPVLDASACAVGVAATESIESGLVTVDSAYDLGLADQASLMSVVDRLHCWPGTRKLQVTMRLAQAGSQSVGESRLRYLCWAGHLPKPELQYEVRDRNGQLVGTADVAWPARRLLGEFDGRVKYGRLLRPGESSEDAVYREKLREDAMREATGWRMIRFTWADLHRPAATVRRIADALNRPAS